MPNSIQIDREHSDVGGYYSTQVDRISANDGTSLTAPAPVLTMPPRNRHWQFDLLHIRLRSRSAYCGFKPASTALTDHRLTGIKADMRRVPDPDEMLSSRCWRGNFLNNVSDCVYSNKMRMYNRKLGFRLSRRHS